MTNNIFPQTDRHSSPSSSPPVQNTHFFFFSYQNNCYGGASCMNSLIRVGSRRSCQCSSPLPLQSCSERQPVVVDGRWSAQRSAAVPERHTRPAESRLPTWISPDASGGRSGTWRNSSGSVHSPYVPVTYGTVMVLLINLRHLVLTIMAKPTL